MQDIRSNRNNLHAIGNILFAKLICLSFLLSFTISVSGENIDFRHLTPENGLSQVSVNDLYQDERGFIWIATREGVNCYDGTNINTYKIQKNNSNSLLSNHVLRITGNKKGQIYFLCTEGISELDIENEKFSTVLHNPDVKAIFYHDGQLYIGKDNQIYVFKDEEEGVKLLYEFSGNINISTLRIEENGRLWVGSSNEGLFCLEKTEDGRYDAKNILEKSNIAGIYQDTNKEIWVGTWEHGLYRINGSIITNYTANSSKDNSISSNFVRTTCMDNQGNLWIGTFVGLDKLNLSNGKITHYSSSNTGGSMTHSSVWSIIKDHQGSIWVGTYFGGVNYFNPEYEIYTHYKVSDKESEGLSSSIVGKMAEDENDNLWICTEGGGVNVYNRKTKKYKWYRPDKFRNSISQNNVKSIYFDSQNNAMWFGTHLGGLNRLDLKTNHFTHYRYKEGDETSLPSDIVRDIVPYKSDLIIATQNGVCRFSPQTGKCKQLFKDTEQGKTIKMVANLFVDSKGLLWIAATGEGVFSYNFATNTLKNYKHNVLDKWSISSNDINHITEDHNFRLWFSTSGSGLDLFNYEKETFENFDSQKNGLLSDCIYEVRESRFGRLLVITNQGFSEFDVDDEVFHNYSIDNGFPLAAVNENALHLTRDGEVFLGGVEGMVSFYEKDLVFSRKAYDIVPTRLQVNGKTVHINDETEILESALYINPKISLESKYSVFNIGFTATNYIPANRDQIIYKLEGFSDEWVSTNGQPFITYTNLNPGKYTLRIKADTSELAKTPETQIEIIILPPWYSTGYAYFLYFILIAVIAFFIIRTYKERIKLQESLKYEQKHLIDVEELNQSKLRFFTSISHEFRTPLTLIIGQMEMLMQMEPFTPKVYNKLLTIYKSSLQMRGLISELLDFRKQEQGHMILKVSEHNIIDFLDENYLLFAEYAKLKKINLLFNRDVDTLNLWYDPNQMQKVVNNLLSNSFKYTGEGGCISITIKEQDVDQVIIELEDSGKGIPLKELDKIFTRFYQVDEISSGTGIGLALCKGIIEMHHGTITAHSEHGQGTTFTITLKKGNAHFSANQFSEGKMIEEPEALTLKDASVPLEYENVDNEFAAKIKGAKMVIVEDNDALREMLAKIFEPFYTVILARDGEEGLIKVQEESPSIVLSDVLMPKMSGIELCRAIKENIDTCHIPVVLLTARITVEQTIEGLHNGADDYVTKPFNVNVLLSRCNNLVNSRIILQEKFSQQPQMTPMMLATNRLDKEMIDKVMAIIDENINNPEFTIDQLASEMGIARTNLYNKLKTITGQTPNKFITTIRLKKAAFILKNSPELTVAEIAYDTGFSSPRYFSKCFKDMYQLSPVEYRSGSEVVDEEDDE